GPWSTRTSSRSSGSGWAPKPTPSNSRSTRPSARRSSRPTVSTVAAVVVSWRMSVSSPTTSSPSVTGRVGSAMQIPKDQILELLKSRGRGDQAAQAENELPDQVDTDNDGGLLAKFGIDPKDLMGNLGDLGGKFGL